MGSVGTFFVPDGLCIWLDIFPLSTRCVPMKLQLILSKQRYIKKVFLLTHLKFELFGCCYKARNIPTNEDYLEPPTDIEIHDSVNKAFKKTNILHFDPENRINGKNNYGIYDFDMRKSRLCFYTKLSLDFDNVIKSIKDGWAGYTLFVLCTANRWFVHGSMPPKPTFQATGLFYLYGLHDGITNNDFNLFQWKNVWSEWLVQASASDTFKLVT